ncbi:hypothetical protein A3B05_00455 [Candidatus Giovannonibacteria bacterium RIFCSPLOWO2_01_FULL_43_160]|uniref:DUF6036 domain-containing protein n=2 Tax=Candidatus Giovannoniibacteriota TaxID=1752738 RepID=A0A0G1L0C4_9BACT|nr:MAG: hypothetical protein UV72_C0014G0024 [Candidatus Giovannonibacteria bacterium GW2011_GWB1_43_13]KKS99132.1 MAG: hypothetical protein UV75_C0009G0016 [Candidatus Giovannonibacteria bacterium GW2011_GWA1_43_15]KKT62047.1 MAG: hypothetical protein UW55_C0018G0014 [Candidatus Giovannonibacteria bacterium GW2011_GWA2_44_26]OGF58321.1 MAG: hypothetical protein A2652_01280 [Candidatus Giovannonibacteria bacterium RIFCSPHIGHO2_01_FULL_43_140]OGF70109.1 MAG: hypothetical protein A3C76_02775 [Can
MEEIDPQHLLKKVTEILEILKIPYAITGGMAIYIWGRPRFTADIDIIIELREKDIVLLMRALKQIDEDGYVDANAMHRAIEKRGEFNFIDNVSGVKVDFWVIGDDEFARLKLKRRIPKMILGEEAYFLSPEDLILSKLLWAKDSGSELQLKDVESILKFQEKLDLEYIRKWASVHDTLSTFEELLKKRLRS